MGELEEMEFIKYNINNIDEFFEFCNSKIEYGWIDENGQRHYGTNYGGKNCLQSPEKLLDTKLGICWDVTELSREYFTVNGYKNETYFIYYDDGQDYPSHSILVFYKDDGVYWFEPMFKDKIYYYSGIHRYKNTQELLQDFKKRFIENALIKKFIPEDYDINRIYIYKFNKPDYGIQAKEYYDSCCSGEKIII